MRIWGEVEVVEMMICMTRGVDSTSLSLLLEGGYNMGKGRDERERRIETILSMLNNGERNVH